MDSNRMESLFVTESLEVTLRTVMIREEFDTGDIVMKENGVSIPAVYRQDFGMIANFGTLMFQRHRPPCQRKRVWDISAIRKPRVGLGGIGLIDDDQHVHVTLHDTVAEAPNCPANYLWSSTGESRIRVVQKMDTSAGGEGDFLSLQPHEILFATSMNLKLEHAFYKLGERFCTLAADQKLSCSDIQALGNTDKPNTSLQAQYLTFARGETLYSPKCWK